MLYVIELIDKFGVQSLLYSDTLKEAQVYCEKLKSTNKEAKSLELSKRVGVVLIQKYI